MDDDWGTPYDSGNHHFNQSPAPSSGRMWPRPAVLVGLSPLESLGRDTIGRQGAAASSENGEKRRNRDHHESMNLRF